MSLPREIILEIFEYFADEPSWWWPIAASSKYLSGILDHVISRIDHSSWHSWYYTRFITAGPGAVWCLYRNIPDVSIILRENWATGLSLHHYHRLATPIINIGQLERLVIDRPDLALWHFRTVPNFITAMIQSGKATHFCLPQSYDAICGKWAHDHRRCDRGTIFNEAIGISRQSAPNNLGCEMIAAASIDCGRIMFTRTYIELLRVAVTEFDETDSISNAQDLIIASAIVHAINKHGGFCDKPGCNHFDAPAEYVAELENTLQASVPMLIRLLEQMKGPAVYSTSTKIDKVIERLRRA